ncbi:MAG: NfeD family protein, partial [Calditrichaceae bacterium]
IAYILFMIGLFGILLEFFNPGSIVPGIAGVISLILAFYALQTLPVNYAGLLLIVFAIILFLLEIKVPSFGLLTIGGIISMITGSIMLYDSQFAFFHIAWQVIVIVVTVTVLFFVFAIGMAVRTYRKKPTTGDQGMIGEIGKVYKKIDKEGTVIIHGEYWKAVSDSSIMEGQKVKVVECDHKHLIIKVEAI